jgi:hypothetical protein
MIRRVTGNRLVRLAGPHAAHPLPANMIDPALREFNLRLNHHIRLSLDTMRERLTDALHGAVSRAAHASLCRFARSC